LRQFVHAGGLLVALGETGTRDETGELLDDRFMEEVFGVRWIGGLDGPAEFAACEAVPAIAELPWPDDVTAGVSNGTSRPVLGLDHMVEVSAGSQTKVLAAFSRGSPAITHKPFGQGHGLFVAGIPTRNYYRREYRLNVLNHAPRVLGRLIKDSATHRPCIRVLDFPPRVPMSEVRPLDLRWAPTAEVFPCVGEDYYLVTVASYFREPMRFGLEIDPPTGKRCREVRELVRDLTIPATPVEVNTVRIEVEMGFDDDLKVFGFFF